MTPEQFCYWLQGRAELQPGNPPTAEEWQSIREHLATVFHKVTPPVIVPTDYRYPPSHTTPIKPYEVTCKASGGMAAQTYC